jgi:hypothetical protein
MSIWKLSEQPRNLLAAGCAMALSAGSMSAPLAAQVQEDSPNLGDVAMTPLDDLGITAKDVPEILLRSVIDPYSMENMHTCNSMTAEIMRLNDVLGEDYDAYAEGKGGFDVGRAAQGLVGSLIPFRGVVREVSGAAGKDRAMQAAITAGMVRRGFLKGIGSGRGCEVPARPRERPPVEADAEKQENGSEQENSIEKAETE